MKHRILFVCHGNICGGDPDGKIVMLMDYTDRSGDVADPWYTGNFEATWHDVKDHLCGYLPVQSTS